jgi:hypothetical protein
VAIVAERRFNGRSSPSGGSTDDRRRAAVQRTIVAERRFNRAARFRGVAPSGIRHETAGRLAQRGDNVKFSTGVWDLKGGTPDC